MIRETPELKRMIVFQGRDVYLEKCNPNVQVIAIAPNRKNIKIGDKIHVKCGDTIIVTFQNQRYIFVSVSDYCGWGVFNERFYMSLDMEQIDLITEYLNSIANEYERKIVLKNLTAHVAV